MEHVCVVGDVLCVDALPCRHCREYRRAEAKLATARMEAEADRLRRPTFITTRPVVTEVRQVVVVDDTVERLERELEIARARRANEELARTIVEHPVESAIGLGLVSAIAYGIRKASKRDDEDKPDPKPRTPARVVKRR